MFLGSGFKQCRFKGVLVRLSGFCGFLVICKLFFVCLFFFYVLYTIVSEGFQVVFK